MAAKDYFTLMQQVCRRTRVVAPHAEKYAALCRATVNRERKKSRAAPMSPG